MKNTPNKTYAILLLNKPIGISSHRALQIVKKIYNIKKAGHSGTLDPQATGMQVICFNEATKFLQYNISSDKTYQFRVALGIKTDTGDSEGKIIDKKEVNVNIDEIRKAVSSFVGLSNQTPPMYSAIKHNGEPLYKIARKGGKVEIKSRQINIKNIEVLSFKNNQIDIICTCSKGTYIRTLAEDIGAKLKTCAYVSLLHRVNIHPFENEMMHDLDKLKNASDDELKQYLLPVDMILKDFDKIILNPEQLNEIGYGRFITLEYESPVICRLYDENNNLIGIGGRHKSGNNILKPMKTLKKYVL